jgi:hypothetical protein
MNSLNPFNFPQLKRWSCAIDVFSNDENTINNTSGNIRRKNSPHSPISFSIKIPKGQIVHRSSTLTAGRPSDEFSSSAAEMMFDPNDRQYRCCCGQSHSTVS